MQKKAFSERVAAEYFLRILGFGGAPTSGSWQWIATNIACRYNVIDEIKIVSSQTVIWLCRFPKHSNIEILTGAESGKIACLVSVRELLTM